LVTGIDFSTLTFGDALYLWLLIAPAVLLVLWIIQVARRRKDAKLYQAACYFWPVARSTILVEAVEAVYAAAGESGAQAGIGAPPLNTAPP